MTQRLRFVCLAFFALSVSHAVLAQELRIYTTIRDLSVPAAQTQLNQAPVVRSLMLFHAGKVYDYIEPAHEITVFEPSLRRFTVLSPRRQLSSELTQDEIRQFLGLAEDEAQKRLAFKRESPRKSLELIRFQLQPVFIPSFDSEKLQLTMAGMEGNFQYLVDGFQPPSLEVLETYLHVADWTAQLNSVLYPQSLLPAPRLKLNQELRQRGMLPLTVALKADTNPALHLEARHEWTWNFQKTDRQLIDEWEKHLRDPDIRRIPFRQFQQEMLKSEVARKR